MMLPRQKHNLYGQILMLDPDDMPMNRIGLRRAAFYLNKNLATKVDETTIKLNFVPNGPGGIIRSLFYIEKIAHQCVVCGEKENLIQHYVVPNQYRLYLPDNYKSHNSYDLLLICFTCQKVYDYHADKLYKVLVEEYQVPLRGLGYKDHESFRKEIDFVKSLYVLAMYKDTDKVPESVLAKKHKEIEEYLGKTVSIAEISELFKQYQKITPKNEQYKSHGEVVVSKLKSFKDFIIMWREHFVNSMRPKFLPKHWKVDGPIWKN